jgi:protein-tyrosine phosphatase
MRILFVCLGNICRSPTAEAVMRHLLAEEGLNGRIEVQSAGTGDWHVGEPPDARSAVAAARRGVRLAGVARQVQRADFGRFDLIVAMDRTNLDELRKAARRAGAGTEIRLLREFDPDAKATGQLDVPDPYFGGDGGFDHVLDLVERACRGLLAELRAAGRA